MIRPTIRPARRAASTVEFAFVAIAGLLFLFGIVEYCRFVFLLQVVNNAAREGARFAVVHTGDGTTKQQVIDEVMSRLSSREKELGTYTVDVFNINPNTGVQISGTQWNESSFGNAIAVRITGSYAPILPSFLRTATSVPIDVTAMMSSEAN